MKYKIIIPLPPITKKNHQQLRLNHRTKKYFVAPSPQYERYEQQCRYFIKPLPKPIDYPVNVKALFYMDMRRKCDLTNLNEALHDILVKCGILKDDNSKIVAATDGSRVLYDKQNPRTEVYIEPLEVEEVC
ncbi:RusA family crossover junction endodeoxyribonuclease [Biomaibacter acetigenes]|uniref:RusA family crossover junction endodeoxyribonuclease n=1 Tax=Biomaibacter acetigenes TaxID=2316383 RepID=A0A3G2R5K0_9FIRM|nr:RusA family crossover junction endodeoxyribonuclease [Biomaibacter acetigenes]AYO30824.1 RusA family crossover junction endodeoxyribonuclease [Biomaibacter acetigenes]